uniref:Uncharacterized protein n=1 Tax=Panagrolaimus sp. ES5 TaxID=591445 RepID=A0AC34FTC8_9BILA
MIKNGFHNIQADEEDVEKLFIKPLINELRYYSGLNFDFRCFILKILKFLEVEQKQRLADAIVATKIDQSLLDCVFDGIDYRRSSSSNVPMLLSQDSEVVDNTTMPSSSSSKYITIDTDDDVGKRHHRPQNRRRSFLDNLEEYNDDVSPPKKQCQRTSKINSIIAVDPIPELDEFIHVPNYKLISYIQNGISKSRLFIFPTSDKSYCYEYFYDFNREMYICCGCNNAKKCTHAIILKDSNGTDYVRCLKTDHICDLRLFKPEKYKTDFIIKKPNYEFIGTDNELLLFTSIDKTKFYKMSYDAHQKLYICTQCWKSGNYIQACVCYDNNGNQYISVRNQKHICSTMNYLVLDEQQPSIRKTVVLPSFQHVVRNLNKKPRRTYVTKKQRQKTQ